MEWLNYHHLHYFWVVAKEGTITKACDRLGLAQPTISAQIRQLEKSLGERLFVKVGRNLQLTEAGQIVFRYADEIFSLGQELTESLKKMPTGRPVRLAVGVTDILPKHVAHRLLAPATRLPEPVRIVCTEGKAEDLLTELAVHRLDLVLAEAPMSPGIKVRAYNHLLGECSVSMMATAELAKQYEKGFPGSLNGAPVLLPTENTSLRQGLDQWLQTEELAPDVRGEFEDSALLKVFGQAGDGLFPVPSVIEKIVCEQYRVQVVGRIDSVVVRFYAISVERRLTHPAVVAISEFARKDLFEPR
jgi:LysR family transcriptional activator of nhaA